MRTPEEKRLMDEIYRRNQASKQRIRQRVSGTPEVGIFWVIGKRILIDSTSITEAESWAKFKTHPRDHIIMWKTYQRVDAVPKDLEYDEVPRGHVGYNTKTKKYLFLADRCILKNKSLVKQIEAKMNLLTENISVEPDEYYRCPKCLKKKSVQEL